MAPAPGCGAVYVVLNSTVAEEDGDFFAYLFQENPWTSVMLVRCPK